MLIYKVIVRVEGELKVYITKANDDGEMQNNIASQIHHNDYSIVDWTKW